MSENLERIHVYTSGNRMYVQVDGKYVYLGTYNVFVNKENNTQIFEDENKNKHEFFIEKEIDEIVEKILSTDMVHNNVEAINVRIGIKTLKEYMTLVDERTRSLIKSDIAYLSKANTKSIMNLEPKYIDSYGTFEIRPEYFW